MKNCLLLILVCLLTAFLFCGCAQNTAAAVTVDDSIDGDQQLAVLWTTADRDVTEKFCFMYTNTAKRAGWFDEVKLIVWGPSAKLLSEDVALQNKIKKMIKNGVDVKACKACSDSYGVSDELASLGIDVKYMGAPLSKMLKSGWKVLTF